VTITSATAIGTSTSTVTVPYLNWTRKTAVEAVIYRTIDAGSVFYEAKRISNVAGTTTTTTDTMTDATLLGKPLLYTSGGVIENTVPPPMFILTGHDNRVVGVDSTDPLTLYISKEVGLGYPAEWSDFLTLRIPQRGGPVTGLASMDDKLLVFKRDVIYIVTGRAPVATGQDSTLNVSLLTTDVGCTTPASIVLVPDGVMFSSPKGIYIVERSLRTSYIGAPVENWNDLPVVSAVLVSDKSQVRFGLGEDSRTTLVYDYVVQQWGTFTNLNGVSAVNWGGLYHYVTPSAVVNAETIGEYTDNGKYIRMKYKTGRIQMSGVQGYQRCRRIILIGESRSAHRLQVRITNEDGFAQTEIVSVGAPGTWGSDATWGSSSPWGGTTSSRNQWRLYPTRQKSQAIQLEVTDVEPDETVVSSDYKPMTFDGLAMQIGVAGRGSARIPAAKTLSTSPLPSNTRR
jgi:hypothetical protein